MGFTKPPRRRGAGGLLHHRFSFSLYACAQVGVFFSAALSVGSPRLAVNQHAALWSPDFPHESAKRPRATVWPASEGDCSTVGPASADAGSPCRPQGSSAPAARFATHCPVGGRGSRHQPCPPRFNRGGRILRGLQAGRASRVRTMACPHWGDAWVSGLVELAERRFLIRVVPVTSFYGRYNAVRMSFNLGGTYIFC